jgi:signal transduction histidine kinase
MLVLALCSSIASNVTFNRHVKQSHLVEQTYRLINETQHLQNLVIDMESSRRGFLSTGDNKYLETYNAAVPRIKPSIDKLKVLLDDNQDQYGRIETLQSKINIILEFWGKNQDHVTNANYKEIIDEEKEKIDDIAFSIKQLRDSESLTLLQKNDEEDDSIRYAYLTSITGTILIMIIVLTLIYYVLKEINNRNRLEEELQNSLNKEKELNEIKSLFVSMASHEFRSPLSVVLSSASLIAKYTNTEQQPQRDKHIKRISASVTFLTQIMNNFLSLGKIEAGEIKVNNTSIELNFQMNEYVDEVKHLMKNGQTILFRHQGTAHNIYADSNLLRHVITNLLTNAIKYSPENSEIELLTELNTDYLKITVKDRGIGIPKEEQAKLFSKFFRSSNAANIQGTGLGLHIVEKYVHLMGGTIEFHSEPGDGTAFIIHLPNNDNIS